MTLAIFDLDNTLIAGDSDNLWGHFACEQGLADGEDFGEKNDQFYRDYEAGTLDIEAYVRFALAPIRDQPVETAAGWHREFMSQKIEPIMLPQAQALIAKHRQLGHQLLIITATNEFVTAPIAHALGIKNLLASQVEVASGHYTGEPLGIPCYHKGKVARLENWAAEHDILIGEAYFYSDSHNDLPLLEHVSHPVAVDPDDRLRAVAEKKKWPIISLR